MEASQVEQKVCLLSNDKVTEADDQVDLLLNASGAKIKPLKNLTLEAGPGAESARGIWSSLHDQSKKGGGYRI
jgi:large subunit ribosomal protein L43